jgi:hypothetical protein
MTACQAVGMQAELRTVLPTRKVQSKQHHDKQTLDPSVAALKLTQCKLQLMLRHAQSPCG